MKVYYHKIQEAAYLASSMAFMVMPILYAYGSCYVFYDYNIVVGVALIPERLNGECNVFISVAFLVCLSVSNITENTWTDFQEIFRIGLTWNKNHSGTFWGRLFHAWLDCFMFHTLGAAEVCALGMVLVCLYSPGLLHRQMVHSYQAILTDIVYIDGLVEYCSNSSALIHTNPRMHLFHIPQCYIQNRNAHISVLYGTLGDMEHVHSGICKTGPLTPNAFPWGVSYEFWSDLYPILGIVITYAISWYNKHWHKEVRVYRQCYFSRKSAVGNKCNYEDRLFVLTTWPQITSYQGMC